MFACLCLPPAPLSPRDEDDPPLRRDGDALVEVAREFSPRVEAHGGAALVLDLSGLERLFGDARTIGEELRRRAADRGLQVRVAIAGTRTAALILAHARAGLTLVAPGQEAAALAPVPLAVLEKVVPLLFLSASSVLQTFSTLCDDSARRVREAPTQRGRHVGVLLVAARGRAESSVVIRDPKALAEENVELLRLLARWGLKTLGDLAALPPDALSERLGQAGIAWRRLARGEDDRPLVPMAPEERVEATLELEWPIEGLEPLSFVFGRLFDPICERLERRDRAVAVLHVRLRLVTRETHERSLQLPAPVRDPRALRTLALLALEAHPPPAAIDAVTIAIDPTPARVWHYSLWARARPSPEELSTLLARLTALMGEGRSGAPALVDSRRPGAFAMTPFVIDRGGDPSPHHRSQSFNAGDAEHFSPATAVVTDPEPRVPSPESRILPLALRRFRIPVPARVAVEHGRPVRVTTDRRGLSGGRVEVCAGPWRTSGEWWRSACGEGWRPTGAAPRAAPLAPWNRDEWDVALADGSVCRIFRDRDEDRWYLEGIVD